MVSLRARRSLPALVIGLVVAACGGTGGSPSASQVVPSAGTSASTALASGSAVASAAAPEKATIKLGLLPLSDVAPVYIAIADGTFADEGLTIEPTIVQGGAAAIPNLVNGSLDMTFGNYVSFFQATGSGGIDLRIIAEQNRAKPNYSSIMTLPDSGIKAAADLVGKKLAVNTLKNVAELTARAQVKDAGGDPNGVMYVEIPFPDMIAALQKGDVDAIFAVEPFLSLAKAQLKAVEVVNPYGGRLEGFPVAGFEATTKFTTENPNTVAAFQRAMIKASDSATANVASVAQILPTYTTLKADVASQITLPEYNSRIDPAKLKTVVDLMVEFGLLDSAPDVNTLVVPTP
jgi:NitT/TauT family transport system substrate-binding protein